MTEQKKRGRKKKDNNDSIIPMGSFTLNIPEHEP